MNRVYPVILSALFFLPCMATAQPEAILLKPDRVFDGDTGTPHAGWVVLVKGETIAAAGPAGQGRSPQGGEGHRASRHHPLARAHRRPLAPAPPPLRRGEVGRPSAEGIARGAHLPGDGPRAGGPAERLHHAPRPWHRGGGLRRCRHQVGDREGDHPRPATPRHHQGHRRDRQLRAAEVRTGMAHSRRARRRRTARTSARSSASQIRAGADWIKVYADTPARPRHRREAGLLARRAEAHRRHREGRRRAGRALTPSRRRGCAGRRSRASRRSSTAMTGTSRSSG